MVTAGRRQNSTFSARRSRHIPCYALVDGLSELLSLILRKGTARFGFPILGSRVAPSNCALKRSASQLPTPVVPEILVPMEHRTRPPSMLSGSIFSPPDSMILPHARTARGLIFPRFLHVNFLADKIRRQAMWSLEDITGARKPWISITRTFHPIHCTRTAFNRPGLPLINSRYRVAKGRRRGSMRYRHFPKH
jgi:hypothetical protein